MLKKLSLILVLSTPVCAQNTVKVLDHYDIIRSTWTQVLKEYQPVGTKPDANTLSVKILSTSSMKLAGMSGMERIDVEYVEKTVMLSSSTRVPVYKYITVEKQEQSVYDAIKDLLSRIILLEDLVNELKRKL